MNKEIIWEIGLGEIGLIIFCISILVMMIIYAIKDMNKPPDGPGDVYR